MNEGYFKNPNNPEKSRAELDNDWDTVGFINTDLGSRQQILVSCNGTTHRRTNYDTRTGAIGAPGEPYPCDQSEHLAVFEKRSG